MANGFEGKVAVVTGAGRRGGLGEAIVRMLAVKGCSVILSDIGAQVDKSTPANMIGAETEMQALAAELSDESNTPVESFVCDVRDSSNTRALAAFAANKFGRLDIWVNNAGIGYLMKPLLEVTPNDWRAVIDVNLTGCFNGIQAAAQHLSYWQESTYQPARRCPRE